MPKVDRTVKFPPAMITRINKVTAASGGYVKFSDIVRNGTEKELAELEKLYGKEGEK